MGWRAGERHRPVVITFGLATMLIMGFLLVGCDTLAQKREEYRAGWVDAVSEFEQRVTVDDKKINELGEKEDMVGVMRLVNERIKYVDSVYDRVADLYPPPELRKLHAVTLFYLTSIVEQFKANIDLYEALRTGKPTGDLKTIAENYAGTTDAVRQELSLAIDKAGLKLKEPKKNGQQPPASAPGSGR